jgi:hypothetical protein
MTVPTPAIKTIPVPLPGEPIDLMFFSTLTQYLNDINAAVVQNKRAFSSLYGNPRKPVETEDLVVWTDRVLVPESFHKLPASTSVRKLKRVNWHVDFNAGFTSVPVVTATPFCETTGAGTIASNSCWLYRVTINEVRGKFKFNEAPYRDETVWINVIAIGPGVAR